MSKIASRKAFHQNNINRVLQQVINNGPISRIEIARNLELNKSSITALYNEIEQIGYLKEVGNGSASKNGGRKPVLVSLNEKFGYTISIDIGYRHLHFMANYLNGSIAYYQTKELTKHNIQGILKLIDQTIDTFMEQETKTINGLLGICFSIHGVVFQNKIFKSPFLKMDNIDLVQKYQTKYQVPVILENEANLSAVYERDFNEAKNEDNILCISIHKGIGAGIILNRHLYYGANGAAGEIGNSLMFTHHNQYQYEKVEQYCSEDAILDTIKEQKQVSSFNRQDLEQLLKQNDSEVQAVLDSFITSIARIIFNAAVSFAPEKIFINSPLMEELPSIFKAIQATTSELKMIPSLQLTKHSHHAILLGACSLITHHVLDLDQYDLILNNTNID